MSSILIRRANMVSGGNSPRLPAGYTELAYIQSTGTQYINTGISGNANIQAKAVMTSVIGSSQVLFCSTTGTGGTFFGISGAASNWGFSSSASSGLSSIPATTEAEVNLTFTSSGCSGTVNLESISRTASVTNSTWGIFACTSGRYPSRAKLWYCKIYKNNALVRDLVPAMRDSDSEVGMYDLVSDTFLTNAGSGTFSYGTL